MINKKWIATVLGACLTTLPQPLFSQDYLGSLTLTSAAPGEVRLVSAPRGSALRGRLGAVAPGKNLELTGLTPGRYRLEAEFDVNFYVFRTRKEFTLRTGEALTLDVSPSTYLLSLQGTADSTGAEVIWDNMSQGVVPLEMELPVGAMVEVRQKGYEIGFFQFDTAPAQRKFARAELTPTPAMVELIDLKSQRSLLEGERKGILSRRSGNSFTSGLLTVLGLGAAGAAGYGYYSAQQSLLDYEGATTTEAAVNSRKTYNFHVNLVQIGAIASASGLGLGFLVALFQPGANTTELDRKIAEMDSLILQKEEAL